MAQTASRLLRLVRPVSVDSSYLLELHFWEWKDVGHLVGILHTRVNLAHGLSCGLPFYSFSFIENWLAYPFFDGFTNVLQANLPYPSDSNLDLKNQTKTKP